MVEKGNVDIDLYLKSLVEYYEGFFDPEFLTNMAAIKIYKAYKKEHENKNTEENIKKEIFSSTKFVYEFCTEREISFDQYFHQDECIIPIVAKHIESGMVSNFFMSCFPDKWANFDNYQKDIVQDYLGNIQQKLQKSRSIILTYDKLEKIAKTLNTTFPQKIEKFLSDRLETPN